MKKIILIIGVLLIFGAGFWIGRLWPSGGAPHDMMGGMGAMPPPGVNAVELKRVPLEVQQEYIAEVEAVQDVMVRSEVSGYLEAVHVEEGSLVEEGTLLFTIDARSYRALVEARAAERSSAQAEVDLADKFLRRLKEASQRSVSQSDLDTAESALLQAQARLKQAEANLQLAEIDLSNTEICAPISGRIGKVMLTRGNYVNATSDPLVRIVQVDPLHVVFSMTDRAYLNFKKRALDGVDEALTASVQLPNGQMHTARGMKDFDDNAMNPKTGTMTVRYLFDNPDGLLIPGGYVTLQIGQAEGTVGLVVPERAILVDAIGSYVLRVDEAGQVDRASVELGDTLPAGMEIKAGLEAGDRVIVDGVQKVQPGMTASVTLIEVDP